MTSPTPLRARFDLLHDASRAAPDVPWAQRDARLAALERMIRDQRGTFARAIAEDFDGRPAAETDLAEMFPLLDGLKQARRQGPGWMKPRKASSGRWLRPARAQVLPRPLGVVGIVAPWNYPLMLSLGPLISAFAAGNLAMLKLSEHAPAFAQALASAAETRFDAQELAVVTGGPEVAEAFTALPFDHLLFTGSTAIGRKVMAAAAANLTPVTLELGGKSPALIAPDVTGGRLDHAAARIMTGKLLNAGQTCIAPDYVLIPADRVAPFLAAARKWVAKAYPDLARNRDYTRIINDAQYARLTGWLEAAGGAVHPLSDARPDVAGRLLPPVAVTDAAVDSHLLRDEIFGPILPILPYDDLRGALAQIAARPRPLAFYPFTDDADTSALLLAQVIAGGVTVNDTLLHVAAPELPFGGVGDSGTGAYHGQAGFDRLSHLMPVLAQGRISASGLLTPPYGRRFRWLMALMLR